MSLKHVIAASLLTLSVTTYASADYCINKDLINLGPTAYDIGVLITPNQPLTWRYDGHPGAIFSSFTNVPAGANAFLHWRNLNGTNAPILTGALVHVGWCTLRANNIVDMWWTDLSGGRVPGSVVYEIGAHSANSPVPGVQWDNLFTGPVVISDVAVAISRSRWDLAALNRNNRELALQLQPLEGGTSFQVPPGGTVILSLPNASQGDWVVVRYSASGNCSGSQTTDFVQFQIGQP
jgi:hypothetical protein